MSREQMRTDSYTGKTRKNLTSGMRSRQVQWQSKDSRKHHLCKACGHGNGMRNTICEWCGEILLLDANGGVAIWQIGRVSKSHLMALADGVAKAFGLKAVIQLAVIPDKNYEREGWSGLAVTPMLNDLLSRHRRGVTLNLGVTASNVVPDSYHNFLFGMAYMGLPAAVLGIEPLTWDAPSPTKLKVRMLQIAIHELGHCLGLDHHGYDDGIDCVMIGDEEVDSVEGIDSGTREFCSGCMKAVRAKLR
jgi:predicted Zn-dependent protease